LQRVLLIQLFVIAAGQTDGPVPMNDELIINWQLIIYWHDELIIFWHANKWMSDSAHHLLAQVHLVYINESP
jgi:hypothetical protein